MKALDQLSDSDVAQTFFRLLRQYLPRDRRSDELYATMMFLARHRRLPTREMLYNDVLHFEKISPAFLDPLVGMTTDKELVKLYVKAVVGEEFAVPTLAVLRSPAAVDAFDFPVRCCIKPTHMSGQVIFRRDGEPLSLERIKGWLATSYYENTREPNYKTLALKVIVEPLLQDGSPLVDYKLFCFEGRVTAIWVAVGQGRARRQNYFDPDWNDIGIDQEWRRNPDPPARPANLEEMKRVALAVSAPFRFVRVDMYSDQTSCCIGELTHCDSGAMQVFDNKPFEIRFSKQLFES